MDASDHAAQVNAPAAGSTTYTLPTWYNQTAQGIAGGLAATFGVIVGDQVLMWLAVAGVAALLTAHPTVFAAVPHRFAR